MDMNCVNLVGRLADNVLYTEGSDGRSSRAVGRLIVNRPPGNDGVRRYDAIQIVAWGKHADNLARYTSKGKEIGVRGEIRTSAVAPKKDGDEWKNYTEVLIQHISFGRDSQQAKLMKAIQGDNNVAEQALAALGAAAGGDQSSFAALLQNNPQLVATLQGIAGGVGSAVAEEVDTPDLGEFDDADTPFSA